ncbi:Ion transporter [filamentous cyanobacterium CCP5]|nr:Ion transporter [filamentous cyanobacterium CCP5]
MASDPQISNSEAAPSAASAPDWRQTVRETLNRTDTRSGRVVNGAIALLILLSAAVFAASTYPLPEPLPRLLEVADGLILAAFTVEYLVRFWASQPRWRYPISVYGLIDLVSILPFIFGFLDSRFLRLLRWLRILRLVRVLEDQPFLGRMTGADTLILVKILFTLFTIIFIYSGLIFQVEHPRNPEVFHGFFDAVYFAVVTMTTVGYGDVIPISTWGRVLTVMMILTGVALVPTQLGNLIRQVTKVSNTVYNPCKTCYLSIHDRDAQYCKRCGSALPTPDQSSPESTE